MSKLREDNLIQETSNGAIIAGYPHAYKAGLYMHDKESRDAAILSFAKHFISIVNKSYYDRYNIPTAQRSQLTNKLLDYFSQEYIYHISDPAYPEISQRDSKVPRDKKLHDYVDANIQAVKSFNSPQVEDAIKSLRP